MAYPLQADLETAISNIETSLLENRVLINGESAWDSWQEVLSFLQEKVVPDAGYTSLDNSGTDFNGVP